MQLQLDKFYEYCQNWKLTVNVNKTKILIFSRGRQPANLKFHYNNLEVEIVNEFTYLGVIFSRFGTFNATKKYLINKATKAMYDVLKKGRTHNLSIQCQLDLFDKIVVPILLYGCEVWGIGKNDDIERVHLKFCKLLLRLKTSTPNFMVYGELGRYPLDICIKSRILSYWTKLLNGKQSKLSTILYKMSFSKTQGNYPSKWMKYVKNILDTSGYSNFWNSQQVPNFNWFLKSIRLRLIDQFKQHWKSEVDTSPKGISYRLFKDEINFENYLKFLQDRDLYVFCKFRTQNHKLPIEIGRWQNIERNERLCNLCRNVIGDEFHYILECSSLIEERKNHISRKFISNPNIIKFGNLFKSTKQSEIRKLCSFIRIILEKTSSPC